MTTFDTGKLTMYLKGIVDWSDPHPELSREMLFHEMKRINTQSRECLKLVEAGIEICASGSEYQQTSRTADAIL